MSMRVLMDHTDNEQPLYVEESDEISPKKKKKKQKKKKEKEKGKKKDKEKEKEKEVSAPYNVSKNISVTTDLEWVGQDLEKMFQSP